MFFFISINAYFWGYGSYRYVVNVVAVAEVEMPNEIPAGVSWVAMRQRHTHRANLGAVRQHTNTKSCISVAF